jgi:hypothetical protein
MSKCFLTGKEGDVVSITVDGNNYDILEDYADEKTMKQLKEEIRQKVESEKDKQSLILSKLDDMAAEMGMSKDELIMVMGGGKPKEELKEEPKSQPNQKPKNDDGLQFREVEDTGLKSEIKVNIVAGDGVSAGGSAYSTVKDGDGKLVTESDKKIAKIDDGHIVEKSNMGTTHMSIVVNSSKDINDIITATDDEHNLIRSNITGRSNKARDCPMCRATGITMKQTCPKCKGSGFIIL